MPTIKNVYGYRFFFYSNDHEPPHIHIEKDSSTAKFLLNPVELLYSKGFKATELSQIRKIIIENRNLFIRKWDEYFNN